MVHNDLHSDNILFDQETEQLSGIIDFTSAAWGSPYHDFRYLHLIDMKLVPLALESYNKKSSQTLSLQSAYTYCMATEFSQSLEAAEQKNQPIYAEIKKRIYLLYEVSNDLHNTYSNPL